MIYHKQKQLRLFFERKTPPLQLQSCRSNSRRFPRRFPTTWELRILTPGELEEQKLLEDKSKDWPGKNDPMTPLWEKPEVGIWPCDPPKKKPEGWKNASSRKKFLNVFDFVIVAFFLKIYYDT